MFLKAKWEQDYFPLKLSKSNKEKDTNPRRRTI